MTDQGPIFVVGVPRSGTTLLSAMLSSHSNICIAPETHFIAHDYRIQKDADLNDDAGLNKILDHFFEGAWFPDLNLSAEELRAEILAIKDRSFGSVFEKLMQIYADSAGKDRWGEKTPGHYLHVDTIFDWYPTAQVIFIIRDPRAICASLVEVPWGNRYVTFHTKRWLDAIGIFKSYENHPRVHGVTYENLVANPESELKGICDFLNESFEPAMIERDACTIPVQGNNWRQEHLSKATGAPLSNSSVARWRNLLSKSRVEKIEYMAHKEMEQFDYEPVSKYEKYGIGLRVKLESVISRFHLGIKRHWTKLVKNS